MNISEIIKQFDAGLIIESTVLLTGLVLFGAWLAKTSWGRKALVDSPPRKNNMPFYTPFIPLFIWIVAVSLAIYIKEFLPYELPDWQDAFIDNLIFCSGAMGTTVLMLFLAKIYFARQLKGFGLNIKTIHKDLFSAIVNLLAIWPFVLLMILATIYIGKFIYGQDYQLQQHEELELIKAYSQLPIRVLIIITTIAVVPIFEEILFRGMFQTTIRSYLEIRIPKLKTRYTPWLAIVIGSCIFTAVHANAGHWPALFVLAMCLGYAYEKSGSLLRPIFIHAFFNTISIIGALNQ